MDEKCRCNGVAGALKKGFIAQDLKVREVIGRGIKMVVRLGGVANQLGDFESRT